MEKIQAQVHQQPARDVLQACLGLHSAFDVASEWELYQDVIFIAVDFENVLQVTQDFTSTLKSQMGIAMLDTCEIFTGRGPTKADGFISTFNYIIGSDSYYAKKKDRCLFGTVHRIQHTDLLSTIEPFFQQPRNIVLVGHGLRHDLQILKFLGLDVLETTIHILDTHSIAQDILPPPHSLEGIVENLGFESYNFHCAGNDANFTLRALLMLALQIRQMTPCDEEVLARMKTIRSIAHRPIIPTQLFLDFASAVPPEDQMRRCERTTVRQRMAMILSMNLDDKIRANDQLQIIANSAGAGATSFYIASEDIPGALKVTISGEIGKVGDKKLADIRNVSKVRSRVLQFEIDSQNELQEIVKGLDGFMRSFNPVISSGVDPVGPEKENFGTGHAE